MDYYVGSVLEGLIRENRRNVIAAIRREKEQKKTNAAEGGEHFSEELKLLDLLSADNSLTYVKKMKKEELLKAL